MTRVVQEWPPNIAEIRERFRPSRGTVFAYGDRIYAPDSDGTLPPDLIVHEETHFEQQRLVGGPEAWWRSYIDDPVFRLAQEVEAYRRQYASVADHPRARRRELLAHICKALASSMYGSLISKEQARRLITEPEELAA